MMPHRKIPAKSAFSVLTPIQVIAFFMAVLLPAMLLPFAALAQVEKPDAAVAPVGAVGEVSEGQRGIIQNELLSNLSRTYKLVSQEEYARAEEKAFEELEDEQCTAEQCIRKIQDILQVERLFVLQVIREADFTQLSLTVARSDDKIVRTASCQKCSIAQLSGRVAGLVAAVAADDLGGAPAPAPAAVPTPSGAGQIFVTSQPSGADILLDGKPQNLKTDNLLENIPAGEHRITLNKGDLTASSAVQVEQGKIARLDMKLELADLEIQVNSRPFKAAVLIDGKPAGETPLMAPVTAGKHKVRVTLPGHLPFEQEIAVKRGAKNRIDAKLVKGGTLRLAGWTTLHKLKVGGKTVSVGGNKEAMLKPGTYSLEVRKEGYRTKKVKAKIAAGKVTKLDGDLEPLSGLLTVTGTPAGAVVSISGGRYMKVNKNIKLPVKRLSLPIGSYMVEVSGEDHEPLQIQIQVITGKETSKEVALTDLRPLRAQQAWEAEQSSWQSNWVGSFVGAGLWLYYYYSEGQAMADANSAADEQEQLMLTAGDQTEADGYQAEADNQRAEADTHYLNAMTGLGLGVVLAGVGTWILLDPPVKPPELSLMPYLHPDPRQGGGVALRLRW